MSIPLDDRDRLLQTLHMRVQYLIRESGVSVNKVQVIYQLFIEARDPKIGAWGTVLAYGYPQFLNQYRTELSGLI